MIFLDHTQETISKKIYQIKFDYLLILLTMIPMSIASLTVSQLKEALTIRQRIDALNIELDHIGNGVSNGSARGGKRVMSDAGRARIAAAQRLRWAKHRKNRK